MLVMIIYTLFTTIVLIIILLLSLTVVLVLDFVEELDEGLDKRPDGKSDDVEVATFDLLHQRTSESRRLDSVSASFIVGLDCVGVCIDNFRRQLCKAHFCGGAECRFNHIS